MYMYIQYTFNEITNLILLFSLIIPGYNLPVEFGLNQLCRRDNEFSV